MTKFKLHPETALKYYLSSLENIELLQDSIDLEKRANASMVSFREGLSKFVFINEETDEEMRFDLPLDPVYLAESEARIAKNEERLAFVKADLEVLLEEHPELVE